MDTPVLLRRVVDQNDRELTFKAAVLAAATTARPGAPRWTELTVYRLPRTADEDPAQGEYVVARIGRSVILHRADCPRANPRRMRQLGMGPVEGLIGCLTCNPPMHPPMPNLLAERTRHTVAQARDPEALLQVLRTARPGQPLQSITGIVAEAVSQLRRSDPDFDSWMG